MAQGVHSFRAHVGRMLFATSLASTVAAGPFALGGCVIPPSLSVETEDAGVNSPPAILAVRNDQQELAEGEGASFVRGAATINLTLLDTDLRDSLYVRVFIDYKLSDPTPARATCTAPPPTPAAAQRSVTCDVSAVCKISDVGAGELPMSIVVFDRQPLDSGTPAFQAMPAGGLKTSRFNFLTCQDPPR